MKPDIGITEKNLQAVAGEFQKILSDEFVLYAKTRNYHWNIEGSKFMEMYKFYELGHYAEGRLKDFIKLT